MTFGCVGGGFLYTGMLDLVMFREGRRVTR